MSQEDLQVKLNQKLKYLQDKKKLTQNLRNLDLVKKEVQNEIDKILPEKKKFEEWARYFGNDGKSRQVLKWFNDELNKLNAKLERVRIMREKILLVQEKLDVQLSKVTHEIENFQGARPRLPHLSQSHPQPSFISKSSAPESSESVVPHSHKSGEKIPSIRSHSGENTEYPRENQEDREDSDLLSNRATARDPAHPARSAISELLEKKRDGSELFEQKEALPESEANAVVKKTEEQQLKSNQSDQPIEPSKSSEFTVNDFEPPLPEETEFDSFLSIEKEVRKNPTAHSKKNIHREQKYRYIKKQPVRTKLDLPADNRQTDTTSPVSARESLKGKEISTSEKLPFQTDANAKGTESTKSRSKSTPSKTTVSIEDGETQLISSFKGTKSRTSKGTSEFETKSKENLRETKSSPTKSDFSEQPSPSTCEEVPTKSPPVPVPEESFQSGKFSGIRISNSREDALYLGIDLGTYETTIAASNGEIATTVSAVGWPKDLISRKMLKKDILFGEEALKHKLALRFYRPLEKGVIKDTDEDLQAANELIKYVLNLVHPEKYKKVYAVIGAPAQANLHNEQSILDAAREVIDAVTIVSEPFAVAYGEANIYNSLVIDIGAGTTDICRLRGTMPEEEDQITLIKAGDYIDEQLMQNIRSRIKGAQVVKDMVRRWKESYSFVMQNPKPVMVDITMEAKPLRVDITNIICQSCEAIVDDIAASVTQLVSTFDPEFQQALKQNILLAGGGSLIRNLDLYLAQKLSSLGEVVIKKVPNPIEAGAKGAVRLAMDVTDDFWREL